MSKLVMKRMCHGCPYNYGNEATEMAYNLGCLPSIGEVETLCRDNDSAWACHSVPEAVCAGFAESHAVDGVPLQHLDGVHALSQESNNER